MQPNSKRPRLENGFLTLVTALSNITNVQTQRETPDNEKRKKYDDQTRRKNDRKAIWAQVKNFEKFVDRLKSRQDTKFHTYCHGSVQVIDKQTGSVTQHYFPKNPQETVAFIFFIFET